jgi:hypothetical protein
VSREIEFACQVYDYNDSVLLVGPVPLVPNAATVMITPSKFTVLPGQTLSVVVTFKPPTGLKPSDFGVYSGAIKATGSDNTTLQSTYMGVAAKMKDMRVIDNQSTYRGTKAPYMVDVDDVVVPQGGSAIYSLTGANTPLVWYRLVGGTPLLRFDLIDAKTNVKTNTRRTEIQERSGVVDSLTTSPKGSILDSFSGHPGSTSNGTFAAVKTLGLLYKLAYLVRNRGAARVIPDNPLPAAFEMIAFDNGTAIPNGTYKILMRALRITGNPMREEDYDVWTSPATIVQRN